VPAITPCMSVFAPEVARPTLVFRGLLGRDGPSRSSSQEDEPWQLIEKLLLESMSPS